MNTALGLIIILAALSSPVWVVYLVARFVRWQDYRAEQRKPVQRCTGCGNWYKHPEQHICAGREG